MKPLPTWLGWLGLGFGLGGVCTIAMYRAAEGFPHTFVPIIVGAFAALTIIASGILLSMPEVR